ncbi:MAG: DUF389 domain-containing protein [Anaerolineales bacterium]|jgi:hypothetical protein|nr:DUF389 domain-containing protein [Anaerolineales bacterium]
MPFSDEPILPTEPPHEELTSAQRVRRRRATRRSSIPTDAEGQAELISSLARRAYPSIELFIFSLVCGAILGLGFLLDSPVVLLLGILVAPLMTPWVGFLLAILTGSVRFQFETAMALLISIALVFAGGLLSGFAARLFEDFPHNNAFIHARLWIPALVVLAIGAVTLVASFARSEAKPFLPSVLIAYLFYLPINAAAFGLGAGLQDIFPQGLYVFAAHFALASILGLVTLFLLRLRPSTGGIVFSGITLLLFAGILFTVMGSGVPSGNEAGTQSTPTNQVSAPLSPTPGLFLTSTDTALPLSAPSRTPTPGTPSPVPLTIDITLPPTDTPTITLTIQPTPTYGRIFASEGGGANLRDAPGGSYMMTLLNGTIVETYSEFEIVNGSTWVKVYATLNGRQIEGWLLESVLRYATPAPGFEPSATPAFTVTPNP